MSERTITLPVLTPRQATIRREARRFNVLNGGRRSGKTELGIDLAVDPVLDGYPCAWVSMTYKNFAEVWRMMTATLAPITTHKDEQEYRIETVIPGGVFEAWTWKNIVAMRGRRYRCVILDEAAYIPDLLAKQGGYPGVVRPTLVDYRGDAWFLSSPNGHNDFETLYLRGQNRAAWPEWRSWTMTAYDNPHVARSEIDALRRELGDRLAAQEIDAQFVDAADVEQFLPSMLLWDACAEPLPALTRRAPMVLAMDAGDTDDTFAAVGVTAHPTDRARLAVRYARVWVPDGQALDQEPIERAVLDLARAWNVVHVAYDKYQMRYMAQRLQRAGIPCEEFGQGADRLAADKSLRDRILARGLAHDGTLDVLRQHLANADRRSTGDQLRIIKRSADRKIDAAVALAMACARAESLNLY